MKNLNLENIAKAVDGTLYNSGAADGREASAVVIDSRLCEKDCIFVAIKGERSDGHSYIKDVFAKGALGVICEHLPEEGADGPCIVVESSAVALKKLAAYYRSGLDIKIVGIVGSVGKTSTKEMVAAVLSQHYNTHKTSGNFNNEIGVPLTLLAIRDCHEAAVVEMGISDFGEMDRLGAIVRPDAVVMTNIGPCHLEFLHDLDGVLKAKSEVFKHIAKKGAVFLNGSDEKLMGISEIPDRRIIYYNLPDRGISASDINSLGLLGTDFRLNTPVGQRKVHVPLPGAHSVINAQAGAAVGLEFGLTLDEIAEGIASIKPVKGRGYIVKTKDFLLIDDCYNANPSSMKAAVDLLQGAIGRKCVIFGDMFELGDDAAELHAQVGRYAAAGGLDLAVFIGELSKNAYRAYIEEKSPAFYYPSLDGFFDDIGNIPFEKDDNILVKASHGMHFDKVLDFFGNNDIL